MTKIKNIMSDYGTLISVGTTIAAIVSSTVYTTTSLSGRIDVSDARQKLF